MSDITVSKCPSCGAPAKDSDSSCAWCRTPFKSRQRPRRHGFMYEANGVSIDLDDLKRRHGTNRAMMIREICTRTGVSFSEGKRVVDSLVPPPAVPVAPVAPSTSQRHQSVRQPPPRQKSCLHQTLLLFAWVFLFPVMIPIAIISSKKLSTGQKIVLFIVFLIFLGMLGSSN